MRKTCACRAAIVPQHRSNDNPPFHVSYHLVSLCDPSRFQQAANMCNRFLHDVEQVARCMRAATVSDVTTPTPLPLGGILQKECVRAGRMLATAMGNTGIIIEYLQVT